MNSRRHPDESRLISWLDGELERGEAQEVTLHVSACAECRGRVEQIREASTEYASSVRRRLAHPPAAWSDLRPRMRELDTHVPHSRRSYRWFAAIAAAAVIAIVAIRLSNETTVSAAELLRNASAAETSANTRKKIRVRTRNLLYTRPANRETATELALRFRRANYNWDEPLSARSFADWRNSLREKDDRVNILDNSEFGRGRFYRVTTSTPEGELSEASVTIRAADLHAVYERFRFRDDEWVEIAEAPELEGEDAPIRSLPPERVAESRHATPSDELHVIAALHAIGADLGDPVEVTREATKIDVRALAADPERQAQIRTALGGLPFVSLRFEQPEAVRSAAPLRAPEAEAPKTNALIERLAAQLGGRNTVENFTNHVLDLSEAALARAHALRSLAGRFPGDTESALSEADRSTLQSIQADHTRHLLDSVRQLADTLKPVVKTEPPAPENTSYTDWRSGTESVLGAAQTLDRALTNALAGSGAVDDPDGALLRLAAAADDLQSRAAALRTVVARAGARP